MIIKVFHQELTPIMHEGPDEITTVLMTNERQAPRNFRCHNCGKIVCQVEGRPAHIQDDGSVPEDKNYIDIMCHRCKIIYRFVL